MNLLDQPGRDPLQSVDVQKRLGIFEEQVRRWTGKINLVASSTLDDFRHRHVHDSVQLFALRPTNSGRWIDLGSGGGFPGMVVAILAANETPDLRVTLVESDQRKAAFLRNVSRETGVRTVVLSERIEHIGPLHADVLSARALAPLPKLCSYAIRHLQPEGTALFPKGASATQEISDARAFWKFDLDEIPSQTDPDARILRLKGLAHA